MGSSSSKNAPKSRLESATAAAGSKSAAQTSVVGSGAAKRLAFSPTTLHKGLQNLTGENNCFLNVTIQALWHLGPFRVELQKLVESESLRSGDLINAICNLFTQYEFTELSVLPPTELREMLANLSDRFQLGSIVDSNEALDAILDRIHLECRPACPGPPRKCLSHLVFGGLIMEQSFCTMCRESGEPTLRSAYVNCVYVTELIEAAKIEAVTTSCVSDTTVAAIKSPPRSNVTFGMLLRKCMEVGLRHCPSKDERGAARSRTAAELCQGKAIVKSFCLEAPLAMAISVGWTQARESADVIREFLSLVSYTIRLSDVFDTEPGGSARDGTTSGVGVDRGPSYVFRGLVCYYGMHYVSIFQEYCPGEPQFLLFDDHKIRPLGGWSAVKEECIKAMYQPVLLLYELENAGGPELQWDDIYDPSTNRHGAQVAKAEKSDGQKGASRYGARLFGTKETSSSPSASAKSKSPHPPPAAAAADSRLSPQAQPKVYQDGPANAAGASTGYVALPSQSKAGADKATHAQGDRNSHQFLRSSSSQFAAQYEEEDAILRQAIALTNFEQLDGAPVPITAITDQSPAGVVGTGAGSSTSNSAPDRAIQSGPSLAALSGDAGDRSPIRPVEYYHMGPSTSEESGVTEEIKVWGRRPVTNSVKLYPVVTGKESMLGFRPTIDEQSKHIVVKDFYRHPVTKAVLPAEMSGRMRAGDRIVRLNDWDVSNGGFTHISQFIAVANQASLPITLTLQSPNMYYLWFECPYCHFEILAGDAVHRSMAEAMGQPLAIICGRCKRSSIGRDLIPGVTL